MPKTRILSTLHSAVLGLYLVHFSPASYADIRLQEAWIAAAPPTIKVLAGYVNIQNESDRERILQSVSSPDFEKIEIHKSLVIDGVASMEKQSSLKIPAGENVSFTPGGLHLMLFNPESGITTGDSVELEFHFDDTSSISVKADVKRHNHHHDQGHHH